MGAKKPKTSRVDIRVPPIAVRVTYAATETCGGEDRCSYADSVQRLQFGDRYDAAAKLRAVAELLGSTVDEMGRGEIIIVRTRRS